MTSPNLRGLQTPTPPVSPKIIFCYSPTPLPPQVTSFMNIFSTEFWVGFKIIFGENIHIRGWGIWQICIIGLDFGGTYDFGQFLHKIPSFFDKFNMTPPPLGSSASSVTLAWPPPPLCHLESPFGIPPPPPYPGDVISEWPLMMGKKINISKSRNHWL